MSDKARPCGRRKKLNSTEAIRRLRYGDLKKVLRWRYGPVLPDDDAGRADGSASTIASEADGLADLLRTR